MFIPSFRQFAISLAFVSLAHTSFAAPLQKIDGLGALSFATDSASTPAQTEFVRGMLLLHLFHYREAEEAFKRAQTLDPNMVLAVWGEAMTANEPVWGQQKLEQGRAALAKLGTNSEQRLAKARNAKEKAWLQSVEVLYGQGSKAQRDTALLAHMEKMAQEFADDPEVQLFYALALLGAQNGDRDVPKFLKAAQISRQVFQQNPQHPGAAHYWIHGMDDPANASGAMEAALALAKIAPQADHAQHMTSHIFIALGMWAETVKANEQALQTSRAERARKQVPHNGCGHYAEWLQYSYLQQGRIADARELAQGCVDGADAALNWYRAHPEALAKRRTTIALLTKEMQEAVADMITIHVVETKGEEQALLAFGKLPNGSREAARWHFAQLYSAIQHAHLDQAKTAFGYLQQSLQQPAAQQEVASEASHIESLVEMSRALLAMAEGKNDVAIQAAQRAVKLADRIEFEFGPPAQSKPPHELLAEAYLAANQYEAAISEFQACLKLAPNRSLALKGLQQALSLAGKAGEAAKIGKQLQQIQGRRD